MQLKCCAVHDQFINLEHDEKKHRGKFKRYHNLLSYSRKHIFYVVSSIRK